MCLHRAALQAVRDAVSNQAAAVFQLYTQHADALDMATCLQRSATCPSVADMLEWLQDAERHYQWEYPFGVIQPRGRCVVSVSRLLQIVFHHWCHLTVMLINHDNSSDLFLHLVKTCAVFP